jgi:hypothetical protein
MAQEHVEDLRLARAALVNARRNSANILGTPFHRGNTERAIETGSTFSTRLRQLIVRLLMKRSCRGGKEKALAG